MTFGTSIGSFKMGEDGLEEINRRDLRDSVSVVVYYGVRPTNQIEFLDSFDHYHWLFGDSAEETRQQFASGVTELVVDCFSDVPSVDEGIVRPRPYHIGPQAQSFPIWLIQLYHDIRPILGDAATLWALGEAAKATIRRFSEFLSREELTPTENGSPLYFSEPILTSLCFSHLHETYSPKKVKISSYVRYSHPGLGDADHPGGIESYTIAMKVGRKTYIYEITNQARVVNHYSILNGNIELLAIPVFDGIDYGLIDPEKAPVRAVEVSIE